MTGESAGTQGAGRARGAEASAERVLQPLPAVRGRGFAASWWGRAWVKALEDSALETSRLPAGRRHARAGAVGAVLVRPGRATAVVRGKDGTGWRADVLLRVLSDSEWDRLLDQASAEAGHLASLLDGVLPPRLVEDAAAAGVDLLPGIGDLEPTCECGAWDHCAHTAALSYQLGRLLDQEPALLLLMRGRGEREVAGEVQRRGAALASSRSPAPEPGASRGGTATAFGAAPSTPASVAAAYAWGRAPEPPPPAPPAVDAPGKGPTLTVAEGAPDDGLDAPALEFLIEDTARRAALALVEALAPGHAATVPRERLTPAQDAARMAADARGGLPPRVARLLASGSGRDGAGLVAAGRAWRLGGAAALEVLENECPAGAPAVSELADAWAREPAGARPRLRRSAGGGRWTVVGEDLQLRRGPDGRWWPYRREQGRWMPSGGPEAGPAAALAAARSASPGGGPSAWSPGAQDGGTG